VYDSKQIDTFMGGFFIIWENEDRFSNTIQTVDHMASLVGLPEWRSINYAAEYMRLVSKYARIAEYSRIPVDYVDMCCRAVAFHSDFPNTRVAHAVYSDSLVEYDTAFVKNAQAWCWLQLNYDLLNSANFGLESNIIEFLQNKPLDFSVNHWNSCWAILGADIDVSYVGYYRERNPQLLLRLKTLGVDNLDDFLHGEIHTLVTVSRKLGISNSQADIVRQNLLSLAYELDWETILAVIDRFPSLSKPKDDDYYGNLRQSRLVLNGEVPWPPEIVDNNLVQFVCSELYTMPAPVTTVQLLRMINEIAAPKLEEARSIKTWAEAMGNEDDENRETADSFPATTAGGASRKFYVTYNGVRNEATMRETAAEFVDSLKIYIDDIDLLWNKRTVVSKNRDVIRAVKSRDKIPGPETVEQLFFTHRDQVVENFEYACIQHIEFYEIGVLPYQKIETSDVLRETIEFSKMLIEEIEMRFLGVVPRPDVDDDIEEKAQFNALLESYYVDKTHSSDEESSEYDPYDRKTEQPDFDWQET
jgi:hypothetical protein